MRGRAAATGGDVGMAAIVSGDKRALLRPVRRRSALGQSETRSKVASGELARSTASPATSQTGPGPRTGRPLREPGSTPPTHRSAASRPPDSRCTTTPSQSVSTAATAPWPVPESARATAPGRSAAVRHDRPPSESSAERSTAAQHGRVVPAESHEVEDGLLLRAGRDRRGLRPVDPAGVRGRPAPGRRRGLRTAPLLATVAVRHNRRSAPSPPPTPNPSEPFAGAQPGQRTGRGVCSTTSCRRPC